MIAALRRADPRPELTGGRMAASGRELRLLRAATTRFGANGGKLRRCSHLRVRS